MNFCPYDGTVALLKDAKKLDEHYLSTIGDFRPSVNGSE